MNAGKPQVVMPGLETSIPEVLLAYANTAYALHRVLSTLAAKETYEAQSPVLAVDHGGLEQLARRVDRLAERVGGIRDQHQADISALHGRLNDLEFRVRGLEPPEPAEADTASEQNTCAHDWEPAEVTVGGWDTGIPRRTLVVYERCKSCGEMRERGQRNCR